MFHLTPSHHVRPAVSRRASNQGSQTFESLNSRLESNEEGRKSQHPSSASCGLTGPSQVDMLGVRYNPVNFGAEKNPGSPNLIGKEFRFKTFWQWSLLNKCCTVNHEEDVA